MSLRVAILLSTQSFEAFFGKHFGLSVQQYLDSYRNDFSWYYASMFQRHGIEPLIYIPSISNSTSCRTTEGIEVRFLELQSWHTFARRLPIWRTLFGRYVAELLHTFAFTSTLRDAIVRDRVDVLYIQEYWSGRFDLLSLLLSKSVRLVGSDHGGTRHKQLTVFKRLAFARVAAITSQTRDEIDVVKSFGRTPIYLPNPVDTDFFFPVARPTIAARDSKTILTVARLENTQKQTADLISAMVYLNDDWSLTIAGEGPDRAMLQNHANDLGVSTRVTFIGFVSDRETMRSLYRDCDVFCLPSAFEAVALVVLEAMSCARPVVVTDIRAFHDLIEENITGLKVHVNAPTALAAAIQSAYTDSVRLGTAARAKILAEYSQASFMQVLLDDVLSSLGARYNPSSSTFDKRMMLRS